MRFLCTIASVVVMSTPSASSAEVLWGINGHPITAYPDISIERQLDYVKDLGLVSYRVNVVDAENGGTLAELVDAAKMRGIEILPVITPGIIDLDNESTEVLYAKSRQLVFDLASRFKEDIRVWELGNEMENYAIIKPCETRDDGTKYPCEWGPAGGTKVLDYYGPRWVKVSAVLKGLSDGVAEADPGIRRAMGTSGWGHTGAFARMKQDDIAWDISVWHIYGEDPEWAFREIAGYGKPIWVTEFNNPEGSLRSMGQQADGVRYMMSRLRELSEKYGVEAAHVYELFDEEYWAPSFEAKMGLVRLVRSSGDKWTPGEPKPAYKAVSDFINGPRPLPKPHRTCDPNSIAEGATPYEQQAAFAYCLVLGRAASSDSIDRWAVALERGDAKLADMILEMMRTPDFERSYGIIGMTDPVFVKFLYLLLLDRPADQAGLDSYVRQMRAGTMSREAVAYGIIDSSEFRHGHQALHEPVGSVAPG